MRFASNISISAVNLSAIFFLLFSVSLLKAQNRKLTALFAQTEFFSREQGPYIETYLTILGSTTRFAPTSPGKFQSSVEISVNFSRLDTIFSAKKYNLLSQEITDTLAKTDFIDVQRYSLPAGTYTLTMEIKDNNNSAKAFTYSEAVTVSLNANTPGTSGIELIDTFKPSTSRSLLTKGDFDLVPMVSNFFHEKLKEITFYVEFYNLPKLIPEGESFLVNMYLESFENGIKVPGFFRFVKNKSKPVIPVLGSFPLENLPSGNYNLVVEARDRENALILEQKSFFQRKNPNAALQIEDLTPVDIQQSFVEKIKNRDSLIDYLKSLRPISNQTEANFCKNVIKSGDELAMRKYFLQYWQKRDAANPETAWLAYKQQVDYVNAQFKTTIKRGYATDRGRVYLQYGKPDSRIVYDREPSIYPYEIWQYYHLSGTQNPQRNNRRFVFYNPDLVTNDYFLLHSDAIGEVRDDRWQMKLQKRNNAVIDFDIEKGNSHFGNNLDDIMNMSR